jgi:hypothetical protein
MGRECRTHEEYETRIKLYLENEKEEIPGRPKGTLTDNSKMRVPEYASQEVQWDENFRIIDSCRNIPRTLFFRTEYLNFLTKRRAIKNSAQVENVAVALLLDSPQIRF